MNESQTFFVIAVSSSSGFVLDEKGKEYLDELSKGLKKGAWQTRLNRESFPVKFGAGAKTVLRSFGCGFSSAGVIFHSPVSSSRCHVTSAPINIIGFVLLLSRFC